MEKGKKACPLCDTEMDADAKSCPSCGVDLSIFDVDKDGEIDFDEVKLEDTESLDELLSEITKSEDISSDIVEDLKSIGKNAEVPGAESKPAPPEKGLEAAPPAKEPKKPSAPPPMVKKEPGEVKKPLATPTPGTMEKIGPTTGLPTPGIKEVGLKEATPQKGGGIKEAETKTMEVVEEEMFECPSCKELLPVSSTSCSNCGVEFVEEEVTQFQCPECSTLVSNDVDKCPSCGAIFEVEAEVPEEAEEEIKDPYKRLQELVEEVKPLLLIAKRYDIDVSEGKDQINKAIQAGRKKDTKAALSFVRKSKETVERVLTEQINERLNRLEDEINEAKSRGLKADVGSKITEAQGALNNNDYEASIQSYFEAKEQYETSCTDYVKAREELQYMQGIVENSTYLRLNIGDIEDTVIALKEAIDNKNWIIATEVATEGKKKALKALPSQIKGEAKKARSLMIDWKSKNMDITKPIRFLKEANIALKNADYGEALKYMVMFKKETKTL